MSDLNDDLDPDFEGFLSDVRGTFEPRRAASDFDEVVARAHRAAPEAVGAAMVAEAASLAKVVPLGRGRDAAPPADAELDAFLADVQAVGEAAVTERRLAGIPSFRLPAPARRWGRWIAGMAAAAAGVMLAYGAGSSIAARRGEERASAAVMSRALDASRGALGRAEAVEAERAAIDRAEAERAAAAKAAAASDAGPLVPAAEVDASAATAGGSDMSDATDPKRRRATPRRPPREAEEPVDEAGVDPLAALDAAAQQRWRSGDLAGAEALFREIIRRDGGGRYTQLAYGDLFVLARQRGDAAAELTLWREYLGRYPRGPHADDASAGICRRADADDAPACWRRYLETMPKGAYRRQAERVVEAADGDEGGAP